MKSTREFPNLWLLLVLGLGVVGAPLARAQAPAILENGYRNAFGETVPANPGGVAAPTTNDPLLPAYQAQRQSGTAFGGFSINGYGTLQANITVSQPPAGYDPQAVKYPKSTATPTVLKTVELRSAIIGRPVVLRAISYNFGGVIPPPEQLNLATGQVIPGFYRAEPLNARLRTTVVATNGVVSSTTTVNATAADLDGTTETTVVSTTTTVMIGQNPQFYWSKHAQKVYATQPGTITIEWRESATTTSKTETYVIATSPDKPERTIFWTENGFNGPLVEVPAGRVNAVNIIYNSLVPKEVATPDAPWIAGLTDFTETDPAKKRYKTFYYETNLIHAYNVQGRVFVEYLGNPRPDGTSESKGTEIVNIIKEATPGTLVVDLGEVVGHRPLVSPATGAPVALEPKIIAGLGLAGQPYLHQQISAGGTTTTLYGVRETQPGAVVQGAIQQTSNEVLIYWMETSPEGDLNLKWPKQYLGYVLQWPADPARYSIYARPDAGGAGGLDTALATAVQLDSANNPALVHQDDPANSQAQLLPGNKFLTRVTTADPTNRSLLRFTRDDSIWFERVYSQLDPYNLNPATLLERTVTLAGDAVGAFATGFSNILNVSVKDPATGSTLIEGVDYTVNAATGVITLIERQYLQSVATLGTLNAGDTVAVRLYAGYSVYSGERDFSSGPHWETRSIALASEGEGTPLAAFDFRESSGGFSVENGGTASAWSYSAGAGVWRTSGGADYGLGSSSLISPAFTVSRTGPATVRLVHRFDFTFFGGYLPLDGGLIQYAVNGGAWQTVPSTAFAANGYYQAQTVFNNPPLTDPVTQGLYAFGSESAGYHLPAQSIPSAQITFSPTTLPYSTVPAIVDTDIGARLAPDTGTIAASAYGADPVYVGYIHYLDRTVGTAFDADAYQDPFVVGFEEAAKGAIIGVNALAGNDELEVWWYRMSTPNGTKITGTYWPSFVQKYKLRWPTAPGTIVLAGNKGSDDLPSLQTTGSIYTQNDPVQPGYNPNEEHALMLNGRAWALRDDLNIPASSEPYVLLHYTEADERPAMRVFQVIRGTFDYPAVAGKVLQSPMPLPLLPPPLLPDRTLASYEMPGAPDPVGVSNALGTTDAAFVHYQKFTWTDRKGILWVYRGPHDEALVTTPPTLRMRYFYNTLPGFHFPSLGLNNQPAVGTITPYLRGGSPGAWVGDPVTGVVAGTPSNQRKEQPLDVTFRPQWPDFAPELRVGETLTLPKLGLPAVRGQASAELIYQQSIAVDTGAMAARRKSARLFDPTRAKVYPLSPSTLASIPVSVNASAYLGKTYFPNLPPHLSGRFYFDPAVGAKGSLVFKGTFMDELVGEKYLQLNVMSAADIAAAKNLTQDEDLQKSKWDAAIDGLATTMETFVEDPGKRGTFIPLRNESATPRPPIVIAGVPFTIPAGTEPLVATAAAGGTAGAIQRPAVANGEIAEVYYGDTAVDSYALSASGGGKGYVVLAVGNGMDTDFTPAGQPVSLQVFKVAAPLYRGELKVINSQNPLDEKLTLQHTGDFAGHPEEYDFEWRYAPPVDGLPLKLYSFVRKVVVPGAGENWSLIHNPLGNTLDPAQNYSKYRSPGASIADVVTSITLDPVLRGRYTVLPDKVTVSDGSVSNATVTLAGAVGDILITEGGSGYTQAPTVTFLAVKGIGSGATGIAQVGPGGNITGVTVTSRGSGYLSSPTVQFAGSGSGAKATATLRVESLVLTNGGIGYASVPTVTFGGGTLAAGGTGASATATIGAPPVVSLPGPLTIDNGNGTTAHGITLPHALLRRTFSATKRPLRLFLSLEIGANDGAAVFLNGAPVAAYHAPGDADTGTTSVPGSALAFDPLPLVFEIDPNALVADATPDNNVFTVELFTTADAASTTTFNLRLEGLQEVENLSGWLPVGLDPSETASADSAVNNAATPPTTGIVAVEGKNRHTIQGSSILTLSDNWLIMRYRAKSPANAAYSVGGGWSKWTEPQLAEGWIKRVLAGINPFQQRVKDLFNHETNTSVSLVEQAGKRWEGDIALNLDNINDSGLIEIYETVLRRGKDLSITGTPAINYGGANDALLLAAGYLSDLYMILGNEAFADAANSTIAFNTDSAANFITQYGDVATSLFSFKGQLATVLDEELALLRGRDDFLLPGTRKTPVYNRMIWNYTRGIDSGEAIYALNYNIKDVEWDYSINPNNPSSLPADGIISAADAAVAYPQGHGDAYGHYLTALTGYYGLLNNENFTWTPRIEAVLVLGTPVSVDYQDERKFAAAAAAVARTASQTLDLTYRQEFSAAEDPDWSQLHDAKPNANTGRTRNWGTDDWASRGGQGALFHWVTANSLLPAVDPNPNHSGIQKIDRTTVPELAEIVAQATSIQQTLDNADAHLNPLGLAAGGLTFDISPSEVDAGKTHYEQIYGRALGALGNAVSAFNNAKGSTQFLRQQEDTLADQRNSIEAQEQAFTNQLIELYGTPYTDDIGPGKTYKQDYAGPDLVHSMYVDLPEVFQDDEAETPYTLLLDPGFVNNEVTTFNFDRDGNGEIDGQDLTVTYTVNARGELEKPESWTGRRESPGRMQTAISDLLLARLAAQDALGTYEALEMTMRRHVAFYDAAIQATARVGGFGNLNLAEVSVATASKAALLALKLYGANASQVAIDTAEAAIEIAPKVVGFANDPSFAARALARNSQTTSRFAGAGYQATFEIGIAALDDVIERLNFTYSQSVELESFKNDNRQLLFDLHTTILELKDNGTAVDVSIRKLDQAQRDLSALQAEGDRIQKERLVFRQHAAAIIQGYRTRDFAFRAFRDEALERYKALFDLSARYTYLAARAYDYETGLLDPDGNASAAGYYEKIVRARALGVVTDGQPQFAGASNGDPGLSGVLAEMAGDWSVAKTRLGFNNPDRYRTTFSLRQEQARIIPGTEGDGTWKDLLSKARLNNILDDPDVRRHAMRANNPGAYAVPGLVLEFSTTIDDGYNFFGKPLAAADHGFSPTSFATKIRSSGVAFKGYIGMDDPTSLGGALGGIGAESPDDPNLGFNDPNGLSATPYIFLIPAGVDLMRSPPLGDKDTIRAWTVEDQAIPLPFNISGSDYSTQPAWVSAASLSEPAFMLRKHQAFRAVPDGTVFSSAPGFTNSRLIGRSVWNSRWKIVIPGNTLLNNPKEGLRIFQETVKDIKLHFETYSYSGN